MLAVNERKLTTHEIPEERTSGLPTELQPNNMFDVLILCCEDPQNTHTHTQKHITCILVKEDLWNCHEVLSLKIITTNCNRSRKGGHI